MFNCLNKIEIRDLKFKNRELKNEIKSLKVDLKFKEMQLRDIKEITYKKQQKIYKLENDIQERNVFLTGLGVEVDKVFKK